MLPGLLAVWPDAAVAGLETGAMIVARTPRMIRFAAHESFGSGYATECVIVAE
jgi:hypothetical protein